MVTEREMTMRQVVLLHGLCGSPDYFDELVPMLEADVYALTLPGHDDTESGPETIDQFADWVIKEIRLRELDRPVVLGHSFGGYITTNLVRRYPDELSGFGLIHSTAGADSDQAKAKRNAAIEKVIEEGVHPFIDEMIPGVFAPDSDQTLIERAKRIGFKMSKEGIISAQEAIRDRNDETGTVRETNLPGLFIYGSKDPNMDAERAFIGAERHTKQTVQASHMGMMEAPETEAQLINAWLDAEVRSVHKFKLIAVSGSLRKASFNTALLHSIIELGRDRFDVEVASIELPLYNDDLIDPDEPDVVVAFKQVVREADGLLVVTPEYNHSIPGVLKNAIDWLSLEPGTPLRDKPVLIAGASPGMLGTVRCQVHLRQVFATNRANVLPGNEIFITHCKEKIGAKGLEHEPSIQQIDRVLSEYYNWIDFWKRNAKK
ncbi:alpha/beta fold hydrolase [Exiguobacterium sp. SH3S2]|nr:alpha/beta fold hydrolase [Exiguobacterium sp. SH3S3]TCI58101.1 alpha/beta fold hydrolase [Exiguobacterium sp. SH5S13]TCI64420.1 alpha/beta fold hydrolase [Exiguobacterium sp. SH3S2]